MYYCGAAAGVGEAYEGAFILTPDGNLPKDAKSMDAINAVYQKAGITLECKTNNDNCTGHPVPPGIAPPWLCRLSLCFQYCGACGTLVLDFLKEGSTIPQVHLPLCLGGAMNNCFLCRCLVL